MRITNNMITSNTKTNINSNKIGVDKYNTQMTTQKKISKASEDPVIAIRSLRLSTSLSHLNQYQTNIEDAESWLDVTETALTNMKSILTDVRTQCVKGSSDTLTADDRDSILKSLNSLVGQVYSEGNADYAGRTIFTGYRTSSSLTFSTGEKETSYEITQNLSYKDMVEARYYEGSVEVPSVIDGATLDCDVAVTERDYDRIRLAYNNIDKISDASITLSDGSTVDSSAITSYETLEAWEEATGGKTLGEDEIVFIEQTGEMIFGENIANELKLGKADLSVTYIKTGFDKGEARPEYYYDCKDVTNCLDADGNVDDALFEKYGVTYTKEDQPIEYTIATNTTIQINTQASEVFDTSIMRDINEMIDVVQKSIDAHAKVEELESMLAETKYADEDSQAKLNTYLEAAKREMDYADDNLQKTYSQYITNFDNYLSSTNAAITNVGSIESRIELTKTRVENQANTVEELKSSNEDRDISDIMIDYYAAYNAYQASLTAASKVGERSLLDYI